MLKMLSYFNLQDILAEHRTCTDELASFLRERGDMLAEQQRNHSEAWMQNSQLGVTERREEARMAGNSYSMEIAKIDGEIEALRFELNHLEILITHNTHRGGSI